VHLPKFYGDHLGVNLAVLGSVLLVLRLADGVVDPLLGVLSDRGGARKRWLLLAAPLLAVGLIALFTPLPRAEAPLIAWLSVALAFVYGAFSLATINHQAWGAELSSDPVERTRITAVREGLALLGVVIAAVLPAFLGGADGGLARFALLFAAFTLVCAAITVALTPDTRPAPVTSAPRRSLRVLLSRPLADPLFRRLLLVFMLNGIAAAIPATLVLFFIADVLDAESLQGTFLAVYFIAGAAGMPLWVKLSARIGKPNAWLTAMFVAIAAFVWASRRGQVTPWHSRSSVPCRALRWELISRCRPRFLPTSSGVAAAWKRPVATSVCGRWRPSSTWHLQPASRCPSYPLWAMLPVDATRRPSAH
jgi:Na+/melibiose symporter-like transporter